MVIPVERGSLDRGGKAAAKIGMADQIDAFLPVRPIVGSPVKLDQPLPLLEHRRRAGRCRGLLRPSYSLAAGVFDRRPHPRAFMGALSEEMGLPKRVLIPNFGSKIGHGISNAPCEWFCAGQTDRFA